MPRGTRCDSADVIAQPGKRRVYSNYGFQVLAETIEAGRRAFEFGQYLAEAVFEPLGMADTSLEGGASAAGFGATSTRGRPGGLRR